MTSDIKIRDAGAVAGTVKEITAILEEYQGILLKNAEIIDEADKIVAATQNIVGTKKYEMQRALQNAKDMENNSSAAGQIVGECEKNISICDMHLQELNRHYQEIVSLHSLSTKIEKSFENEVNNHRILQTKLITLLMQIEKAY